MDFITRAEAKKALNNGGQVLFHWHGNSVEVTLNTTLSDLRKAFWRGRILKICRNVQLVKMHSNGAIILFW